MIVAFPKAYVNAEISKLLQKGHYTSGLGCNSLMGPTCFYSGEASQMRILRPGASSNCVMGLPLYILSWL